MKELESEVAELSFWKNQATARMEQSEKVKYELQERLADLMKLGMVNASAVEIWQHVMSVENK